jgi:ubiquinone/menaquinone biosynthesis C-methylase UbiE
VRPLGAPVAAAAAIISAVALFGQSGGNANQHYQTEEQRRSMGQSLSAADRDKRQKPVQLVAAMNLREGMTVADVGTGTGYMLPFLSRAVGESGRVVAEDVFRDFLDTARANAAREKLANVTFVQGTGRDPRLGEAQVDVVLMLDSYHHFDYPSEMLARIHAALRPDGRLVVVDYHKSKKAMGGNAVNHIRMDEAGVIAEVEAAGFRLVESHAHVPDEQYMATFARR